MAKARQQYFADETTLQKESREFAITPDIINKLDSIETGAQVNVIETVKVNGTALVPDANKAVNVEVPDVIDNLFSTSTDDALSAKQGKVLYDYLQNIASRGRYLSNWNCVTGLAMTNPSENPYPYKAGDYYSVSNVAAIGGTNYRPNGTQYIIGQASTTVETELVSVSDFYLYDGTNWLLLANSARQIAVDSSLSTTSTNPVENRVVTNAINGKQDTLVAGNNIQIASDGKTISATDTTYSAGTNISIDANNEISATDTTYTAGANIQISNQNVISATDTVYAAGTNVQINNNVISATDTTYVASDFDIKDLSDSTSLRSTWSGKQDVLTAGTNIQIDSNTNTISATDTTYTAGTGISIDSNNVISNTQTSAEWGNITGTLSDQTDLQSALDAKQDDMVILSYGNSTWNDFITAYQKNGVVYCRASSNSNPATGTQGRLAFMAYVNSSDNPTEVEFQYYRSRSDHSSAANQLDEVYVYKLTSNGTWTVTQRNTAAKATAGTGINLTYGSGNMTIANTGVTSVNGQTGDVTISGAVWGNIIGNIADQTDLQEAISSATSGAVSDTAYGDSWDGITGIAPSKNAVYDKISAMDVTISGKANSSDVNTKTFTLSSTSDITNATSAVNWYENGNTPIIKMTLRTEPTYFYLSYDMVTSEAGGDRHILYFKSPVRNGKYEQIVITTDTSWSVTRITESEEDALSTQIAYTTKGTSTKVPTITTNTLGQVTAITETNIAFPVTSVNGHTGAVAVNDVKSSSTAPSNPTEGMVWYDTMNDQLKVYDGTNWNVTGKEYNAGEGIAIGAVHSDMQGPAPDGFHVPLNTEWQAVYNIRTALGGGSSDGTNFGIALKLPFAGYRDYSSAGVSSQGSDGFYWSSSRYNTNNAYYLYFGLPALSPQEAYLRAFGFSVRCFKNSPTVPTSSWTKLYGTSIEAGGIFRSSTDGLISLSSDGQTWITIADKNLGATTVWNSGDTLSEANCGGYFQWGNNYMFPFTGSVTTSPRQVDASSYGPGNYYSSSTFIADSGRWDTTDNGNLRGGVSQGTWIGGDGNTITNTGVLSVNGETGDVTITAGDMSYSDFNWASKTGATITLDLASTISPSADFTVNAPLTIKDGQTYILRVNNEGTAYEMTLGTNVTNPYDTDITLTDDGVDQFVFLAINGELELQPEGGGGGGGAITADTTGTTTSISKIWVGTEAEYQALGTYEEGIAYMTF